MNSSGNAHSSHLVERRPKRRESCSRVKPHICLGPPPPILVQNLGDGAKEKVKETTVCSLESCQSCCDGRNAFRKPSQPKREKKWSWRRVPCRETGLHPAGSFACSLCQPVSPTGLVTEVRQRIHPLPRTAPTEAILNVPSHTRTPPHSHTPPQGLRRTPQLRTSEGYLHGESCVITS